jgi:hypothetical protein
MKKILIFGILIIAIVIGSCSKASKRETFLSSVSGKVVDGNGEPIEGAIVVVGSDSPTGFTDKQGNFNITGVSESEPSIQVIVPGYGTLTNAKVKAGQADVTLQVYEDAEPEKAPMITIDNLTEDPKGGIAVDVTITSNVNAAIVDARAEVIGTGFGTKLVHSGAGKHKGVIPASNIPGGFVVAFAIDANGKIGVDIEDVGKGPTKSITGGEENWLGSLRMVIPGGHNHGRLFTNMSLNITPEGEVSGTGARVSLFRLIHGLSPLVIDKYAGEAKALGNNLYKLTIDDVNGVLSLRLMGRVAEDFGWYSGFITGKLETLPVHGRFLFINTAIIPNPWTTDALAKNPWGLSFFYREQASLSPTSYQYNVILDVDESGNVVSGTPTTLGYTTLSGASLSFTNVDGLNLGYFTGDPGLILDSTPTATSYTIHGMMAIRPHFVRGVWSSSGPAFGTFWGNDRSRWEVNNFDAQWQGFFVVTSGPDAGQIFNAQMRFNENGALQGGSIVALPEGSITGGNISLTGGSLSFVDPTYGAVTGTLQGTQEDVNPVSINMSDVALPASASMGVYHCRIIGLFSISTNGDSGFYFLFRNSRN